jgi:hypothetical protein
LNKKPEKLVSTDCVLIEALWFLGFFLVQYADGGFSSAFFFLQLSARLEHEQKMTYRSSSMKKGMIRKDFNYSCSQKSDSLPN